MACTWGYIGHFQVFFFFIYFQIFLPFIYIIILNHNQNQNSNQNLNHQTKILVMKINTNLNTSLYKIIPSYIKKTIDKKWRFKLQKNKSNNRKLNYDYRLSIWTQHIQTQNLKFQTWLPQKVKYAGVLFLSDLETYDFSWKKKPNIKANTTPPNFRIFSFDLHRCFSIFQSKNLFQPATTTSSNTRKKTNRKKS